MFERLGLSVMLTAATVFSASAAALAEGAAAEEAEELVPEPTPKPTLPPGPGVAVRPKGNPQQQGNLGQNADDNPGEDAGARGVMKRSVGKRERTRATGGLTVRGRRRRVEKTGSTHTVSSAQLEKQNYDDPHAVLSAVPGVYVRQEDGVGLRPNIGARGVSPDRSKKVNLTEDGVLLGPAPYSAPAAYYFPLMTRMASVRIVKGPPILMFGPQTVAAAINLLTRSIPKGLRPVPTWREDNSATAKVMCG